MVGKLDKVSKMLDAQLKKLKHTEYPGNSGAKAIQKTIHLHSFGDPDDRMFRGAISIALVRLAREI